MRSVLALLLATLTLGGCAYRGDIDNPVTRKFSWFSFVGGDDIRDHCQAGALDRYRLVYNGRYGHQLRIYEWRTDRSGDATLETRVVGPANLTELGRGLLKPWSGVGGTVALNAAAQARLRQALAQAGFDAPAPQGLRLSSQGFYWVASACVNGHFHFNAWRYPSARFQATLPLADALLAHDPTGIAFAQPVAGATYMPDGAMVPAYPEARDTTQDFVLQVGRDGLQPVF